MRFVLPIACALTFCLVCFGHSDAIIPFGYLLVEFLRDETTPPMVRGLLLVPFAVTLFPSFVTQTVARSLLMILGMFLLTVLWLLGIVVYVVYPMPGNQIPNWVPAVTSVPFLLTVSGTMTYSIRTMQSARRKLAVDEPPQQSLAADGAIVCLSRSLFPFC
jgi:hypothetical protein